jgi:hypothetical protein
MATHSLVEAQDTESSGATVAKAIPPLVLAVVLAVVPEQAASRQIAATVVTTPLATCPTVAPSPLGGESESR